VAIALYIFTPSTTTEKLFAVAMYGILVLVTWITRLPYVVRAGVFLLLLYSAGFSSLFDYGLAEAAVLFLGFIVMTGLLLSPRAGIYYAGGITLLALLFFGRQDLSLIEWARAVGIFLVVSATVAIGLRTALQEFVKTQKAAEQMLDALQEERFGLEQRIAERTTGLTQKTEQLRAILYCAQNSRSTGSGPSEHRLPAGERSIWLLSRRDLPPMKD
jgi:membrane protein implicated in regulation of membrane protease activity